MGIRNDIIHFQAWKVSWALLLINIGITSDKKDTSVNPMTSENKNFERTREANNDIILSLNAIHYSLHFTVDIYHISHLVFDICTLFPLHLFDFSKFCVFSVSVFGIAA